MGRLNLSTIDHSVELGILSKKGLTGNKSNEVERHFAKIMSEVGLEPRAIMASLAYLMQSGEADSIKLAAAKFATQLWMHPALVQKKETEATAPVINFVIEGQNVQINNVLRPTSSEI